MGIVDWTFNSWGGKYPPYDLDDRVPSQVAELLGLPCFKPGIVMEGGALDTNGMGTLLTTESCLLNPNRNPGLSKREIERYLKDYLGVSHILWLGEGIAGDDTDGHIDDLARFVNPTTVVTVVEDDSSDPNYWPLRDNLKRLQSMNDQNGNPLQVVTLPMPAPSYCDGQRLPASYANFYVANSVVLVPTYDPEKDPIALEALERLFPERRIIGMDCTDLVWGLGAFHCISQQQPAGDSHRNPRITD
jgi:agmatine deiminase